MAPTRWYYRRMEVSPLAEPDIPTGGQDRLWAPWRMAYVGKQESSSACIFCARLEVADDVASLILHRGEHTFVIMNLFPYNTGHVMIVPQAHVADLSQTDDPTLTEMAVTLPRLTRAFRRALNCEGFNVGLNIGAVAGAGIADHLHQHVVPRWNGDANFMPIIAATTVMPELIPVTYAKLRVELHREMGTAWTTQQARQPCVISALEETRVLVVEDDGDFRLPGIKARLDQALWRTSLMTLDGGQGKLELVGVTAGPVAESEDQPALVFQADSGYVPPIGTMMPLHQAWEALPATERSLIPDPRR